MTAEARRAEQASEPLDLQTAIETIPALAMCALTDGSGEFANRAWQEYTGFSLQELIGRGWQTAIHPDDLAKFIQETSGPLAAGKFFETEARIRRADGSYHWFLIRRALAVSRTHDGESPLRSFISFEDINDRRQKETARRYSEERYRVVVETAPDPVVGVDESGAIRFANPAIMGVFGYQPAELIGKPLTVLMPECMRKLHEKGFRRYLATSERHINWQGTELTGLHRDGREFPIEVSFGELTNDGHRLFTGFIRDISQRKLAEEMRAAHAHQIAVHADVSVAFGKEESLKTILGECSEAIVRHLDAAFARIWTLSGDGKMLELQASAGMYTHLDGAHSRIPIGQFKIGMIAQERKPHLTNDVLNDPRISDRAWAEKEGMVSFAGHPLIVGDRTIGVLAMFSRSRSRQEQQRFWRPPWT